MSDQLVQIDVGPSSAYARAIAWASVLFAGKSRKGKPSVPYLSHLFSVAALVMQDGGGEAEVVAAVLHDAMEDEHVPADEIRSEIGGTLGEEVGRIVFGCSDGINENGQYVDSDGHEVEARGPGTWCDRKQGYLEHLRTDADPSILRVSAADKLDNARDLVADLYEQRSNALREFNASPEDQLWWYNSLVKVFDECLPKSSLTRRLVTTVREINGLVDVAESTLAWESLRAEKALLDRGWSGARQTPR